MITNNPNQVSWIDTDHRSPLCDVPWYGTAVVLSDGNVNFCCYSSAVVGNVNEESFEEIWNGMTMKRIRKALSQHRLPLQCQTTSCPFFRGDELNYIYDRMAGAHSLKATGTMDPHAKVRERLHGSELVVTTGEQESGDAIDISLEFSHQGEPVLADVFVAIRYPDGAIRFLPNFEDYAAPLLAFVELREDCSPLRLTALDQATDCLQDEGEYEVCAALFEGGSNPNLLSNCYWSECKTIVIGSQSDPMPIGSASTIGRE